METLKAAHFSAGKHNPARGGGDPYGVPAGERTSGPEGALQVIALPFWRSIYRSVNRSPHPSSHSPSCDTPMVTLHALFFLYHCPNYI
jgi:hypothetical protein